MMKYKILFKEKYRWKSFNSDSKSVYYKSSINFFDKLLNQNFDFLKLNSLEMFLKNSEPFNNFIYEDSKNIICAVDKLNSDNILYSTVDNVLYISNDIREIINLNNNNFEINPNSVTDTKLVGYVLGNKTIVKDINSLQAGQYLIFNKKNEEFRVKNYFNFFSSKTHSLSRDKAFNKLKSIEDKIFNELIERNKDKKILLALSGGLDSRYVLTSLLKRNFKNITVYSYGHKNNFDSFVSKKIADKLNLEWKMFESTNDSYKKIYQSIERQNYWNFADQGIIASNLYFFESVKKISEQYDPKKTIILNGQAGDFITGDHLPDFKNKEYLLGGEIPKIIYDKHFQLNKKINKINDLRNEYENAILDQLKIKKDQFYHYQDISKYLELWEWQERQTKRVINMQKVYEFFNFDWELPLWHDEYINFWIDQSYEHKVRRNLFVNYVVESDEFDVFNYNEETLSKWLTTNTHITIFGKIIKLIFTKYGSEYFYNFMNLFCKFGFMYSPYKLSYYLKKFNEYKDPLAFLNDDWIENYKKILK